MCCMVVGVCSSIRQSNMYSSMYGVMVVEYCFLLGAVSIPPAGILAAVLGDGSINVYAVPSAEYLATLQAQGQRQQQQQQQHQQQPADMQASDLGQPQHAQPSSPQVQPSSTAASLSANRRPCVLHMKPWMTLSSQQIAGSIGSCCSWHPCAPHDKLLVSSWDGYVMMWRLPVVEGTLPC